MINSSYLDDFLEDEIDFHREIKTPLSLVILCRILGKKTPCEAVCDELAWVRHYVTMLSDTEAEKQKRTYTINMEDGQVSR